VEAHQEVFAQFDIETSLHSFRKAFVSGLIEGGLELITVSRFSRHRSIQQLQTYYMDTPKWLTNNQIEGWTPS
jgi:integrase